VKPSFLEQFLGQSSQDYSALSPEQRAGAVRRAIPDLNFFFEQGKSFSVRQAPRRSADLAGALLQALISLDRDGAAQTLDHRIITDELLRREADRDQNVYLGSLFTRLLTRAAPDVIFQPVSISECVTALRWGRDRSVPVTLRGAASTAMGGSVPNDGGLTLDLSRLDTIELDAEARVVVIGAGARLRTIHTKLAQRGMALTNYPSNLGGTLVGWFVTGGIGLNAFGRGRALDGVKAADLLLPSGEHLRFHDDAPPAPTEASQDSRRRRGRGGSARADAARSGGHCRQPGTYGLVVRSRSRSRLARPSSASCSVDGVRRPCRPRRGSRTPWGLAAHESEMSPARTCTTRKVWEDEDATVEGPGKHALFGRHAALKSLLGPADLVFVKTGFGPRRGHLSVDSPTASPRSASRKRWMAVPLPRVLGEESLWFAAERFAADRGSAPACSPPRS
jgi:hypothetical protein